MRSLVLASAIILLSSCCSIPDQAKLPIPPTPVYPTIEEAELQCLTDHTYEKLMVRDTMCIERVTTMEDIIRATH